MSKSEPLTKEQAAMLYQVLQMTSKTFLERERTGGVAEGCPREPAPTANQVAGRIGVMLDQLRAHPDQYAHLMGLLARGKGTAELTRSQKVNP